MQLHELRPAISAKKPKRIGRGGKRGTTSGRGTKGQKSRAGHRIRPAIRDLIIRIPKFRGFRNKSLVAKPRLLSLDDLAKVESKEITLEVLKKEGVLGSNFRGKVKILGGGGIHKPVDVKGLKVSESARMKIEKAGGKVS